MLIPGAIVRSIFAAFLLSGALLGLDEARADHCLSRVQRDTSIAQNAMDAAFERRRQKDFASACRLARQWIAAMNVLQSTPRSCTHKDTSYVFGQWQNTMANATKYEQEVCDPAAATKAADQEAAVPRRRLHAQERKEQVLPRDTAGLPFDCSRKPAGAGASWDATCLHSPKPKTPSYRPSIDPQMLARRSREQCRSAANQQSCVAQAKFTILMNEDPVVRRQCRGIAEPRALVECVDDAYLNGPGSSPSIQRLRREIRRRLDALPDTLPSPHQGQTQVQQTLRPDDPSQTPERTPVIVPATKATQDNEIFCSFVAYRIHHGDLAYSRAELVPPECRGKAEIREALEDFQRRQPAVSFDRPDREFISNIVDEMSESGKNLPAGQDDVYGRQVREQLPPAE